MVGFSGLPCHMSQPEQNEHSSSTHSMLWHWLWSGLDQGKDLTIGCKGNLFPETGLCRAVVATVGVYSSSTFAGAQISDGGCSTPAYPPIQVHMGHTSPGEWFHKRTGVEELGTMISCASFLKALIIKMVTELGKRTDVQSECVNRKYKT